MNIIIKRIETLSIEKLRPKEIRLMILMQHLNPEQKEIFVQAFHEGMYFSLENQPKITFEEEK